MAAFDFNSTLAHHILDHEVLKLGTVGGVNFGITKHLVMIWLVGGGLVALLTYAARGRSRAAALLRVGVEAAIVYVRDNIVKSAMGPAGAQYLHYFLTLFLFILGCNLAGMIPLDAFLGAAGLRGVNIGGTATGNISVTAGLAACTLGFIMLGGIRAQGGVLPFLRHFVPLAPGTNFVLMATLGPLLFFLELLGVFVKCFALTLRLFVNMIAGHAVALGFMSMIFVMGAKSQSAGFAIAPVAIGLVTFVNVLELLVAMLQAFIFTLLTAVFVGMVAQHGHGEEHAHEHAH